MALPFLEKEKTKRIPVEKVRELASRGFSEIDIIDFLRKEGYSPEEIDAALTDAVKEGVIGITPPMNESELPKPPKIEERKEELSVPETSVPKEPQEEYLTESDIEVMIRAHTSPIEEKIKTMENKISSLEGKIAELEGKISEKDREKMMKVLLGRMDELKDSIVDLETRIGGMEKAFKEALPALIESVRGLSEIVKSVERKV